jgi:hypothetical protein
VVRVSQGLSRRVSPRLVVLFGSLAAAALALAPISSGRTAATSRRLISYLTKDQGVWVTPGPGRRGRRIASGEGAAISPSGALVAVLDTDASSVTLYPTGAGSSHTFSGGARTEAQVVAWSHDSDDLAVAISGADPNRTSRDRLAVINTLTMKMTVVARGLTRGASFTPAASDRLVYAAAGSDRPDAPTNLFTVDPDGRDRVQITHDGHSLDPVWGAEGIAFDRERVRQDTSVGKASVAQIWLRESSGRLTQLTHIKVSPLAFGLVPFGFDRSGRRLLAEFEGEDADWAWTVNLATHRVREIFEGRDPVQGAAISGDGRSLLVVLGGLYGPGRSVAEMPFGGGTPTRVAQGGAPSWNF